MLLLSELAVLSKLRGEIRGFARGSGVVEEPGLPEEPELLELPDLPELLEDFFLSLLLFKELLFPELLLPELLPEFEDLPLIRRTIMGFCFPNLFSASFPVLAVDGVGAVLESGESVGPTHMNKFVLDLSQKSDVILSQECRFSSFDTRS